MSCNESKTVLRVEIPHLKGRSMKEALEYFRPIIGDPDDLDEWNGEIEYFSYNADKHDYIPVDEYSYGETNDDRWGIDLILAYENDYGNEKGRVNHSLEELNVLAEQMAMKFNIDTRNVRLLSYTWYNGSDEPREFE